MRIRIGRVMPVLVLGLGLAAATASPGARAQDNQGTAPENSPGDLAREGLEQMLRALRLLVERIPQYELPEVLDNGDIIIRRKNPEPEEDAPEIDETAT